jgi:hypothetical protein
MRIGNFDLKKGFGKFLLGAIGVGLAYVIQNPNIITSLIPEKWATMTLSGALIEFIDYILSVIKKKSERSG